MNISERILKEHLIPKDYEKPRIEIGNYYLKWNDDKSYGIDQKEIPELKGFLRKAIAFFDTSYELLSNLEKPKYKDKYLLHTESLSPRISLSHRSKNRIISYELYMRLDGSTFIDRVEGIEISNNSNGLENKGKLQGHSVKPRLYLKWSLGELLFNRQG